jgi:WD40 repeat protein
MDSKGSVRDIAFSPSWLGLQLATCSGDGYTRIYEAVDLTNLSQWALMDNFEIFSTSKEVGAQCCVSWCQNRLLPPQLIVSCGPENVAKVQDM